MIKVLMFGWEFPPHVSGGLGTACYGLTRGMAYQQMQVTFVVPKAFGDEDQRSTKIVGANQAKLVFNQREVKEHWKNMNYIEVDSLLMPYMAPEYYQHMRNAHHLAGVDVNDSNYTETVDFTGEYGPNLIDEVKRYAYVAGEIAGNYEHDLIHAHDWLTFPAGLVAKFTTGKPLFVHVHATEFDRSGDNINQQVYEIERHGMQYADKVIAVSNRTRQVIIDKYGIDPNKVVTLHNAVAMGITHHERYENPLDEKIVTFLGRVTFQKGPEYFVEAARKVLAVDDRVRFVMAGSGDMLNRMISLVAKYRIGHKFNFTGFLLGPDVRQLFDMSNVYVMPSVSEPFGISPLEAMQSHVPTIISRQSGVAEVLHHAIKVDFWDTDAMADAIYAMLHYDGISRLFQRMGREEVENLKWDNVAYKLKDIYQSLLNTV